MAEEQTNEAEGEAPENQATPKASRGSFKLLGAVVGLIALGSTRSPVSICCATSLGKVTSPPVAW